MRPPCSGLSGPERSAVMDDTRQIITNFKRGTDEQERRAAKEREDRLLGTIMRCYLDSLAAKGAAA